MSAADLGKIYDKQILDRQVLHFPQNLRFTYRNNNR